MAEFIHKFKDQSEFVEYVVNTGRLPFVSTTVAEAERVDYIPRVRGGSESKESEEKQTNMIKYGTPLTFLISGTSSGYLRWKTSNADFKRTIEYSINGGAWVPVESTVDGIAILVSGGDTISFRGDNYSYSDGTDYTYFYCDAYFKMYGNLASLLGYGSSEEPVNLIGSYTFSKLFYGMTYLKSAKGLVLPSTKLTYGCYLGMFQGCSRMVEGPEIPRASGWTACYNNMFAGCSSLNQITAHTTDNKLSATTRYSSWVNGVSSVGSFYADIDSEWTIGTNGIPTTWASANTELTVFEKSYIERYVGQATIENTGNYSFNYNAGEDFYVSSNNGRASTASDCRVSFFLAEPGDVVVEFAYGGETCCDNGYFSNIDAVFTTGNTQPSSYKLRTATSTSLSSLTYTNVPAGDHFFDVKFRKDGSVDSGIDALKFRVIPPVDESSEMEIVEVLTETDTIIFPNSGGAIECVVRSLSGWRVAECPDWVKVSTNKGFGGDADFNFSAETFSGGGVRTGKIILEGDGGLRTELNLQQSDIIGQNIKFNILSDGYINFKSNSNVYSLTYSKNGGEAQTVSSSTNGTRIEVVAGDVLELQNIKKTTYGSSNYYSSFSASTAQFSITGDFNELIEDPSSYRFYFLFRNCTSLISVSGAIVSPIINYEYSSTFYGCSNLVDTPIFIGDKVGQYACTCMFQFCTGLTTAPESLPAKELKTNCYYYMFQGCISLENAPELPATELAPSCYYQMFSGCTSLTTAPELPATKLYSSCYQGMFQFCTGLTTAPKILPAKELKTNCYYNMFYGTKITKAPILLAEKAESYSCYGMFYNCTNLNYIDCSLTGSSNSTYYWVYNVSGSGTFVKSKNSSWSTGTDGIPTGWNVITKEPEEEYEITDLLLFYLSGGNATIGLGTTNWNLKSNDSWITANKAGKYLSISTSQFGEERYGSVVIDYEGREKIIDILQSNTKPFTIVARESGTLTLDLRHVMNYSQDSISNLKFTRDNGLTWEIKHSGETIDFSEGEEISFKVDSFFLGKTDEYPKGSNTYFDEAHIYLINSITFQFEAKGDLLSIANKYWFKRKNDILTTFKQGALRVVRYDFCKTLSSEKLLKADELIFPSNCHCSFYAFFSGCTNLVTPPDLSNVIITNVDTLSGGYAPDGTFREMFVGCTSLAEAPELPSTSVSYCCYMKMFSGCTSLTEAPELPATELDANCYSYMFANCTGLTSTVTLPAENICTASYLGMFKSCTSLTEIKPINARVVSGFSCAEMFSGCTSLSGSPDLLATQLAPSCYSSMFAGCGNLVSAGDIMATVAASASCNYMFGNCSGLTTPPNLMPTKLGYYCYRSMFNNCKNLTTVPVLPATELAEGCYYGMLAYCTSLQQAPSLPATVLARSCYCAMFSNCTSLTVAPEIPATTVAASCCNQMFAYCSGLTTAPSVLPASELADYCYEEMFIGCKSLTTAPTLPATKLANGCYNSMFQDCENLSTAPDLLAADGDYIMTNGCYSDMFYTCRKLSSVKCLAYSKKGLTMNATGFVYLVSGSGIFYKSKLSNWVIGDAGGIPTGWTVQDADDVQSSIWVKTSHDATYTGELASSGDSFTISVHSKSEWAIACPDWVYPEITNGVAGDYEISAIVYNCEEKRSDKIYLLDDDGNIADSVDIKQVDVRKLIPLTFTILSAGTIVISVTTQRSNNNAWEGAGRYKVSRDLGETWTTLTTAVTTFNVDVGDVLQFKGNATLPWNFSIPVGFTGSTATFNLDGNFLSLYEDYRPYGCNGSISFSNTNVVCASGATVCPPNDTLVHQSSYSGFLTRAFSNCTKLVEGPSLDFKFTNNYACDRMYQGCVSLKRCGKIGIERAEEGLFKHMFSGCTSLVEAPELNLEYVGVDGCLGMFLGCTSLQKAPELTAKIFCEKSYGYMFSGCTSLIEGPSELGGSFSANSSYYGSCPQIFGGCTAMTKAPTIKQCTFINGTKYNLNSDLFASCSSLTYVISEQTYNALNNPPNHPIKIDVPYGSSWSLTGGPWTVNQYPIVPNNFYFVFDKTGGTISLEISPRSPWSVIDKDSWVTINKTSGDSGETSISVTVPSTGTSREGRISFLCEDMVIDYTIYQGSIYEDGCPERVKPLHFKVSSSGYVCWKLSATTANQTTFQKTIEYSLNSGASWSSITSTVGNGTRVNVSAGDTIFFRGDNNSVKFSSFCGSTAGFSACGNIASLTSNAIDTDFRYMFSKCTGLTSASNLVLPSVGLTNYCYYNMFFGCNKLVDAPELQATKLSDYCYHYMFYGCSALTQTPELPATTLKSGCYNGMFEYCNALTVTPEINAETIESGSCYYMFAYCSGLTSAAPIPAKTVKNYGCYGMFAYCKSLTDAPQMSATTVSTYSHTSMFYYCTSLTGATIPPATRMAEKCYYQMFCGCSALVVPPELPSTALSSYCYQEMFRYCTNLGSVPNLPATSLPATCYQEMFSYCTNIPSEQVLRIGSSNSGVYNQIFYGSSVNRLILLFDEPITGYSLVASKDAVPTSGGVIIVRDPSAGWTVPSGWILEKYEGDE